MKSIDNTTNLAVIGLGYVGLPLALEFGKYFNVIGFDINKKRIKNLKNNFDKTREVTSKELKDSIKVKYSDNPKELRNCNVYIITVPTPIDLSKRPNLKPLLSASHIVANVLAKGDLVIYESTVYPGAVEEECVPVLAKTSGLKYNQDFFCGYSPERINPGDKLHTISKVKKITSGSNNRVASIVDKLYLKIVKAGTHKASSIRVAEAAKVIENVQRDLNIALVNELAIIFNKLNLDTSEILEAAGTKWNFLKFQPGLVGGHCIGVDPYYLTYKAEMIGHFPQVILAGRRINDGMGTYIISQLIRQMIKKGISILNSRILIMGMSFKENCPDIRNTRVVDLIDELNDHGVSADVYDPLVCPNEVYNEYGIDLCDSPLKKNYDAIILAVAHDEFIKWGSKRIRELGKPNHLFFDLKSVFSIIESDIRL